MAGKTDLGGVRFGKLRANGIFPSIEMSSKLGLARMSEAGGTLFVIIIIDSKPWKWPIRYAPALYTYPLSKARSNAKSIL